MNSDVQGQEKAADPLAHGERGRGRIGGGREGEGKRRGGGEERKTLIVCLHMSPDWGTGYPACNPGSALMGN